MAQGKSEKSLKYMLLRFFLLGILFSVFGFIFSFVWAVVLAGLVVVSSLIGLIIGFILLFFVFGVVSMFLMDKIWNVQVKKNWMSLLFQGFALVIAFILVSIPSFIIRFYAASVPTEIVLFVIYCFIDGYVAKTVGSSRLFKVQEGEVNDKLLKEKIVKTILFLCALSSIGIVFFIVFYMIDLGYPIIIDWLAHGFESGVFNILPYMFDSLYLALGGTLFGIVIGIPCAVYLAEFAKMRLRNMIKPTLEVLNGFPSVIIGLLGFTLLCTQLSRFGLQAFYCTLVGWIVLGVMSLPLISSVSEDSLRAVPQDLREASLGLGATKWQTTIDVLLPSAFSGILTSVLLAFANALGETMAVLAVIGIITPPSITLNPLLQSNSITALIAYGYEETSVGSQRYLILFAAGFILFVMTALTNLAIRAVVANRNKEMGATTRRD